MHVCSYCLHHCMFIRPRSNHVCSSNLLVSGVKSRARVSLSNSPNTVQAICLSRFASSAEGIPKTSKPAGVPWPREWTGPPTSLREVGSSCPSTLPESIQDRYPRKSTLSQVISRKLNTLTNPSPGITKDVAVKRPCCQQLDRFGNSFRHYTYDVLG